jgi:hypothetical protein
MKDRCISCIKEELNTKFNNVWENEVGIHVFSSMLSIKRIELRENEVYYRGNLTLVIMEDKERILTYRDSIDDLFNILYVLQHGKRYNIDE